MTRPEAEAPAAEATAEPGEPSPVRSEPDGATTHTVDVEREAKVDRDPDPASGTITVVDAEPEPAPVTEPDDPDTVPPLALTKDELAESAGCSVTTIIELERYGLIKGRKAGPVTLYGNTALMIARICTRFGEFGLDPRHLRTFLIGAEREVGLVHQVVEPLLHRRDESTRRQARQTLSDLTDLADDLRSILMQQALEELMPKR